MKVIVVDYGLGNLHSVVKALHHEGADARVSVDPAEIQHADRLVLPGVGAFADGMAGLRERNLIDPLLELAATGRPLLGICLGMQLLLGESAEFGCNVGLGIIPGTVEEIPRAPGRKVPHVGWNRITPTASWSNTPLASLRPGTMMYFVHSFTAVPAHDEHRLADADHAGHRVSAAVRKDNVIGTQFHPEKSGTAGLVVLAGFLK